MKHKELKSGMTHAFGRIPGVSIPRSTFNLSHRHKTSFDAGFLIPVLCKEVNPGETWNVGMSGFARLTTAIKPTMDNMYLDTHFFFVPKRLIWQNWEKFCGAQTDPGDSTDYTVPTVQAFTNTTGYIADYFGLPLTAGATMAPVALPFRAYNLIWNDWFRDQNLQDSVTVPTNDGPDNSNNFALLRRGKRHDYFTSCLPWPQKSDDGAVTLPLGTTAPVLNDSTVTDPWLVRRSSDDSLRDVTGLTSDASGQLEDSGDATVDLKMDPNGGLYTDLNSASGATINALREAVQVQVMYERDARGGTRYVEILRSHFGITNHPDARLQRPEYLGGGSSPVNMHPVPQLTASPATPTTTDAQGNLAAFATASMEGHGFVKSFVEHGYIIGLASVRADLSYQQGIERMWSRSTRFDFYWPGLAQLGEQEVLNKEIFFSEVQATDDAAFGYQERYAEYRYGNSMITGKMRSDASGTLDVWHLAQDFASLPALDSDFIEEDPPMIVTGKPNAASSVA